MKFFAKRIASKLPFWLQREFRRVHFARQIKKGRFTSQEKEYFRLPQWVDEGDWVVDIGANVGHYTSKLSEIVGRNGRVIAIEPVSETFAILSSNVTLFPIQNVTLLNIAASDSLNEVGMSIPKFSTGLYNFYRAKLSANNSTFRVLCIPIDSLSLNHTIKLVKIDTEGHDFRVLKGMEGLLRSNAPTLIVEDDSIELIEYLRSFGYTYEKGDSNIVFFNNKQKHCSSNIIF